MSAEDYHDVPGFGGSTWIPTRNSSAYSCNFCKSPIKFNQRKPFNLDGTPHRCKSSAEPHKEAMPQQAMLFAMAAMNAIISGSIQSGGVDFIHHMNFYDVADAAWQASAAMVKREEDYRDEIVRASKGGAA